ncbi:hypothetical protein NXS19_008909 [Fusarium pseudograminearum]|nr:hypothetical protein NXS19_008909 [Fusarium pseudograminearum]
MGTWGSDSKVKPLIPRCGHALLAMALGFLNKPSLGGLFPLTQWVNAAGFSGLVSLMRPEVPFNTLTIVRKDKTSILDMAPRALDVGNENGHKEMKRWEGKRIGEREKRRGVYRVRICLTDLRQSWKKGSFRARKLRQRGSKLGMFYAV